MTTLQLRLMSSHCSNVDPSPHSTPAPPRRPGSRSGVLSPGLLVRASSSVSDADSNHALLTSAGGLRSDRRGAGGFVCDISQEPYELLEFPHFRGRLGGSG